MDGTIATDIVRGSGKGKGWRRLIRFFQSAYPEGTIRKLPRVYKDFFERMRLIGGDINSMDRYLNEVKLSKANWEKADRDTVISDGVLGFFVLKKIWPG